MDHGYESFEIYYTFHVSFKMSDIFSAMTIFTLLSQLFCIWVITKGVHFLSLI